MGTTHSETVGVDFTKKTAKFISRKFDLRELGRNMLTHWNKFSQNITTYWILQETELFEVGKICLRRSPSNLYVSVCN